jgi:hypothetical protein
MDIFKLLSIMTLIRVRVGKSPHNLHGEPLKNGAMDNRVEFKAREKEGAMHGVRKHYVEGTELGQRG